ncbi:serine/threonine-protein kinase [Paraliomyxa miuraensis]|uniref:serine/threonine-protein kinase n=1 Tax=Paraliomyxa miuraensis TaxID=376150 RepID=UPI002258D184|nr:serine/threonine-protein kinase [Paraliomyxa miuraensis]MCX4247566.1 serine/threonine protein kinase [Paraliomyxa miuraensis]
MPGELVPGVLVGGGRFVVGELLGRGGMATVYAGHDRRLDREVALKVMLGDPREEPARAQRFEREAELVARLPLHRGLLRWLGAGRLPELEGRPFLATERVPGPTLAFRMAAALCMRPDEVVRVGLGLAEALVAAHGVGIVHRDLTARNVVLASPGGSETNEGVDPDEAAQPVLVDFGLAAVFDLEPRIVRLTCADQRPGTVTAMAPEQYRGAAPHPSMDVYAVGRLLHQMLTGEDPHATVSRTRLLELHYEGVRVVPRLAGRDREAPSSLGSLIDACTEPESRLRPSAEELCGELRAITQALGGKAALATVISFPRPTTCSTEVHPVVGSEVRDAVLAPVGAQRTALERWWFLLVIVGVAALVRGWLQPDAADPLARGEAIAGAGAPEPPEPPMVAWPSTVVPLATLQNEGSNGRPSGVEDGVEIAEPSEARAKRGASQESRSHSTSSGGAHPRMVRMGVEPSLPWCETQRQRARAAARRWAWAEVLEVTAESTCWPEPSPRMRLRLVAWIEQQRFDACVSEGAAVHDPALVRLVERCRRRLDRTGVVSLGGGAP